MEYVKTLEKEFLKRKEKNQRYSLRAFSQSLGIQSATLSGVLNKTRHLSTKDATQIADKLFSPDEAVDFLKKFFTEKTQEQNEGFLPDDAHFFPLLSGWEHGAIFSLMDTIDFCENPRWVSARLNITEEKALESLSYLERIGLIEKNQEGKLVKTTKSFRTSQDVTSYALQLGHQKELELAKDKQQNVPVDLREYGSLVFAIDKKDLPKIKKKIRLFADQMEKTFEGQSSDEVYYFTYQLFPVTGSAEKGRVQ